MLEKIKKCVKNSFILAFTFTFTTAIMIFHIVNINILKNGRSERDFIRKKRLC